MMTLSLPPIPYRGPISTPQPLVTTPSTPPPILKRRPHARRVQAPPSNDLPPVSEEDEGDLAEVDEPEPIKKPRRRPRPSPLIPPRSYTSSRTPLILEIPDAPIRLQEQTPVTVEHESFALSPSTLFARRRSETILDFPVPPSALTSPDSLRTPATPPRYSPTPSNGSFASTSTGPSSPYPLTPNPSDDDDDEFHRSTLKEDGDELTVEGFMHALDARSPGRPRRSASVLSLRSFSTAEFDERAEPIYALMQPKEAPMPPVPRVGPFTPDTPSQKRDSLQVQSPCGGRSPRLMLSVLDTARGGSFDVPLVLGSFLSLPSSPSSLDGDGSESEGEGIPTSWSDCETDDGPLEAAIPSSEEETSDGEAPSFALDPIFRGSRPRRNSRAVSRGSQHMSLTPLKELEDAALDHDTPDTPSVYSMASPAEWNPSRMPPRESLVPCDVFSSRPSSQTSPRPSSPCLSLDRAPSPRSYSPLPHSVPQLRSRFSSSTLASIPEPPSSATGAFFARLTGRSKSSSPTKSERRSISTQNDRPSIMSSPTRTSTRRRTHVPASPAPSAFSFSTQSTSSRSSLDSTDSCSCASDESSGSSGLRRPPIPIELFLRG
ncbi:hypothetical protein K439DRAFT_1642094 [Ramaria rubella]|nr:hypothetical protein K439DRAFT_1642094 [Ramaria rubella]